MTVWFTSDLHFGHRKVAELRGFPSVEAHDQAMLYGWIDSGITKDDLVWVLGDCGLGNPKHALDLMAGLPGRKRLITGNHDAVHPMRRDAATKMPKYAEVFEYVSVASMAKVLGINVVMSHMPYERDRVGEEPRYPQWRLPDMGMPLLHGHTHGTERLTVAVEAPPYQRRVEVHVGVDAWNFRPVSDRTIHELLVAA